MRRRAVRLVLVLFAALALLALGASAAAAMTTYTWTGAGGDGKWSTAANWSPAGPLVDDPKLVFPASAVSKVTTNDTTGIVFYGFQIDASDYSFSGNSSVIDVRNGITTTYSSGTVTLPFNMWLHGGLTLSVAAGGTLDLSGTLSGSTNVTKWDEGTLQLDGSNTFTGHVLLSHGTLLITSDNALGPPPGVTDISPGAQLALSGDISVPEEIYANGTTTDSVAIAALRGSSTLTGPVARIGNTYTCVSAASGAKLTFAGKVTGGGVSGSATFTKLGAGTLEFTNAASGLWGTIIFDAHEGTILVGTAAPLVADITELQATGGTFALYNGVTLPFPLTISGYGAAGAGALQSVGGDTTYSGPITLGADAGIGVSAGTLTVSAIANSAFGLRKSGPGTLVVAGTPAYAGPIDVAGGSLRLDGTLPAASLASVASGAALGGSGTGGHVSVLSGGRYSPGQSPGLFTVGTLTLAGGATFFEEMDGTGAGTQYDQTHVSGALSLGGATLALALGFTPAIGEVFTIIANEGLLPVSGSFAGLPEGAVISAGGSHFVTSYVGGDGNDVTLTAVHIISASSSGGGSLSPAGVVALPEGGSQTFTISPAPRNRIARVLVDGAPVSVSGPPYQYAFTDVTGDHTISVAFVPDTFMISASAGPHGTISLPGNVRVPSGGSQSYAISPERGYHVADVRVDGRSVGAVTSYTFTNVSATHTISASFAVDTYTIRAFVGTAGHGRVSPFGTQIVAWGSTATYTFTPDRGYYASRLVVDGVVVAFSGPNRYTFTAVTGSHTLQVFFTVAPRQAPR
jgi:autotransporter-associated beta strand protein